MLCFCAADGSDSDKGVKESDLDLGSFLSIVSQLIGGAAEKGEKTGNVIRIQIAGQPEEVQEQGVFIIHANLIRA